MIASCKHVKSIFPGNEAARQLPQFGPMIFDAQFHGESRRAARPLLFFHSFHVRAHPGHPVWLRELIMMGRRVKPGHSERDLVCRRVNEEQSDERRESAHVDLHPARAHAREGDPARGRPQFGPMIFGSPQFGPMIFWAGSPCSFFTVLAPALFLTFRDGPVTGTARAQRVTLVARLGPRWGPNQTQSRVVFIEAPAKPLGETACVPLTGPATPSKMHPSSPATEVRPPSPGARRGLTSGSTRAGDTTRGRTGKGPRGSAGGRAERRAVERCPPG